MRIRTVFTLAAIAAAVSASSAVAMQYNECHWEYFRYTIQCGTDGSGGYNTTVTNGTHYCDGTVVGRTTSGGC